MNKRILITMGLFLIFITVVSCTPKKVEKPDLPVVNEKPPTNQVNNYPLEITDDFGNVVTIEKAPNTIISLSPNNTEILYALGLGDKVIGVTSESDYPKEALEVEKVGDLNEINLERIIELSPDLIIGYGPGNDEDNVELKEAGIPTLAFMPKSIDSVIFTINAIAEATGTIEEAKIITQNMIEEEKKIKNLLKDVEKKTVFYEYELSPLKAAGQGSIINELINSAGGINIGEDKEGDYPLYNFEQIIDENPEVYLTSLILNDKISEIKTRPGFNNIDAIKTDSIYELDHNIISVPGPRIVKGLELIAKAIHPELFK